jgi:flavin reductase (DIM6/NTAB) family NADH-FMN oxidoreductase RutF
VGYHEVGNGLPVIDGAVGHIECEWHSSFPAGDHTIFLGRVTGGAVSDRRPLIHYRGGYAALIER